MQITRLALLSIISAVGVTHAVDAKHELAVRPNVVIVLKETFFIARY